MTEHKHPEHFPEHLRPYLLPIPETREEALFLLRCFADVSSKYQKQESTYDRRDPGSVSSS